MFSWFVIHDSLLIMPACHRWLNLYHVQFSILDSLGASPVAGKENVFVLNQKQKRVWMRPKPSFSHLRWTSKTSGGCGWKAEWNPQELGRIPFHELVIGQHVGHKLLAEMSFWKGHGDAWLLMMCLLVSLPVSYWQCYWPHVCIRLEVDAVGERERVRKHLPKKK